MEKVFFVKAYCMTERKPFFMRYDYAADDCWVRTYGVKELSSSDAASMSGSGTNIDVSGARRGPQYKCPWCGNKSFWRHGACGTINCWDGDSDDVVCGKCGTACTLGDDYITTLSGTSGSGQ